MRRAPHIELNEKSFRRQKRAQLMRLIKAAKAFEQNIELTPANTQTIQNLNDSLKRLHEQCKGWWYNR